MGTETQVLAIAEKEQDAIEIQELESQVNEVKTTVSSKSYADIVKEHADSVPTFCFESVNETRLNDDETSVENEVPTFESAELLSVPEFHSKRKKRRHRSRSRNRDHPEKPTQVYEIIEPDFSDVGSDHQDSGDEVDSKNTLVVEQDDIVEVEKTIESQPELTETVKPESKNTEPKPEAAESAEPESPIEEPSKTKRKRQKKKGKKVKQDSQEESLDVIEVTEVMETTKLVHEVVQTAEQELKVKDNAEPEGSQIAEPQPEIEETTEQQAQLAEMIETQPDVAETIEPQPEVAVSEIATTAEPGKEVVEPVITEAADPGSPIQVSEDLEAIKPQPEVLETVESFDK